MSAHDVLETLADGEFHSGQDLADRYRVSRTAIWKQVATLESLGLEIERVRGRGYRIAGGLDLLNRGAILDAVRGPASGLIGELVVLSSVDSTNAELQRREPPASGAAVCLAESQSAGRGRRGRSWVSPFASSIYLSVAWRFHGGAEVLEGLSLAVGVVLADAITALGVSGTGLKWPNDLLLDGKKSAGILVELSGDLGGPCTAIIGMGVNVRLPASQATQIEQPWADLQSAAPSPISRNGLVAEILNRLLPLLRDYEREGFAASRDRWQSLHAHAGQHVIIEQGGKQRAGTALGVNERGALMLQTESGVQELRGGEVSLRPAG